MNCRDVQILCPASAAELIATIIAPRKSNRTGGGKNTGGRDFQNPRIKASRNRAKDFSELDVLIETFSACWRLISWREMKMKTTKLLLIALVFAAMAASSAVAQTFTRTSARTSIGTSRYATNNWNHHRHYRSRANVHFNFGFGYPYYGYGYGYPYYGACPYGYGCSRRRYTA